MGKNFGESYARQIIDDAHGDFEYIKDCLNEDESTWLGWDEFMSTTDVSYAKQYLRNYLYENE